MEPHVIALLTCSILSTCSALGAVIAYKKRRKPVEGLFLGLLTGPIGVLVEACLPSIGRPEVCEHAWNSFQSVVTYQETPAPRKSRAAR